LYIRQQTTLSGREKHVAIAPAETILWKSLAVKRMLNDLHQAESTVKVHLDNAVESRPEPDAPRNARRVWPARIRWFLAEFLVVLAGILAALGLNAWWQQRENRARELAFLRQLEMDLLASEQVMTSSAQYFYDRAIAAAAVSRAFWNHDGVNPDSLSSWMARPLSSQRSRPVTGTAEALTSSGDLRLIRSDSVRSAILGYLDMVESRLDDIRRYDETYYRDGIGAVTAIFDPNALRESHGGGAIVDRDCADVPFAAGDAAELALRAGTEPFTRSWCAVSPYPVGTRHAPFPSDPVALLSDRNAYSAFRMLLTAHRNQAIQYAYLSEGSRLLRELIRKEIDTRSW
jgi:hypothetical protein